MKVDMYLMKQQESLYNLPARVSRYISLLPLILLLTACSSVPDSTPNKTHSNNTTAYNKPTANSSSDHGQQSMQPDDLLYVLLMSEYHYWEGSPYRFGGNSLKGIDCSSLIQKVYKKTFNITLPRTTELQVRKGYSVRKSQLKVGDLVFFKTGWSSKHAGIYLGNNQFFHASTSKGVIISDLNNPYWQDHYWQSRRVIK